jgi:hypothetical protein
MKETFLQGGKRLCVYDDMFDMSFRVNAFEFVSKSLFRLGWGDSQEESKRRHMFLHSRYSAEDVERLGMLKVISSSPAAKELDTYALSSAVVNLSTPSDCNFVHTHVEDKVLLYYVNLTWGDGWHGETLFFDEAGKEIVYASPYTPGRLISFDAKIPHAIRPQSHIADAYRFTLALIFNKNAST